MRAYVRCQRFSFGRVLHSTYVRDEQTKLHVREICFGDLRTYIVMY